MPNSILSTGIAVLSLQTLDDDTEEVIIMDPKSMETENESAEMEGDKYESGTDMSISSGDDPILTEVPKKKGHMPHARLPLEKVNNIRSRQAIIRSIKSVIGVKRPLEKPGRQITGVPPSKLSTFHIISCLLYDALWFNFFLRKVKANGGFSFIRQVIPRPPTFVMRTPDSSTDDEDEEFPRWPCEKVRREEGVAHARHRPSRFTNRPSEPKQLSKAPPTKIPKTIPLPLGRKDRANPTPTYARQERTSRFPGGPPSTQATHPATDKTSPSKTASIPPKEQTNSPTQKNTQTHGSKRPSLKELLKISLRRPPTLPLIQEYNCNRTLVPSIKTPSPIAPDPLPFSGDTINILTLTATNWNIHCPLSKEETLEKSKPRPSSKPPIPPKKNIEYIVYLDVWIRNGNTFQTALISRICGCFRVSPTRVEIIEPSNGKHAGNARVIIKCRDSAEQNELLHERATFNWDGNECLSFGGKRPKKPKKKLVLPMGTPKNREENSFSLSHSRSSRESISKKELSVRLSVDVRNSKEITRLRCEILRQLSVESINVEVKEPAIYRGHARVLIKCASEGEQNGIIHRGFRWFDKIIRMDGSSR